MKTSVGHGNLRAPLRRRTVWQAALSVAFVLALAGCTPGGLSGSEQTAVAVANSATARARAQTPSPTSRATTSATATIPANASPSATPLSTGTSTPAPPQPSVPQATPASSLPAASATAGTALTVSTKEIKYTDPERHFSFILPEGWQKQQTQVPGIAAQFVADRVRGDVNIVTEDAPGVTLDEYVTATIAGVRRNYPNLTFDTKSVQTVIVGGQAARQYGFSGDVNQTQIQLVQIAVINSGTAYVITFTVASQDADAFAGQMNRIIQTFGFLAPVP